MKKMPVLAPAAAMPQAIMRAAMALSKSLLKSTIEAPWPALAPRGAVQVGAAVVDRCGIAGWCGAGLRTTASRCLRGFVERDEFIAGGFEPALEVRVKDSGARSETLSRVDLVHLGFEFDHGAGQARARTSRTATGLAAGGGAAGVARGRYGHLPVWLFWLWVRQA